MLGLLNGLAVIRQVNLIASSSDNTVTGLQGPVMNACL
jgi:hypothetical protein